MPVELIIQNNEYLNQYKNGETFASSTSDVTYNLAGCVMEKIQYSSTMDVSWFFQATEFDTMEIELTGTTDLIRFKKTSGSFVDDGFSIGDDIDMIGEYGGTNYVIDGDVTVIQNDWMYVQFTATVPFTQSGTSSAFLLQGKSSLTALVYSFGLIDNNENFNTNSKISNNNQSFYVNALVTGVAQTMTKQGNFQDWITGSVTCEKQTNPSTYVQRFEIIHNFIVNPFYLDGELTHLQNNTIPSLYSGLNSLKHVVKADFRIGLSNPNTSKIGTMDSILGSTGYFNENMNGFNNIYSISSVTYEDPAASSADGILTADTTTIRVKIAKSGGSFTTSDKVGAFVSYLPPSSDYQNKLTDVEENFVYDNAFCLADGTPVANTGVIDSVTATVNAGDIDLVIVTSYSSVQQAYIATNADPYFLLAIQVGDVSLTNPNSDRVMLIADALPFDTSADISGLIILNDLRHFGHDMVIGTDVGYTSYKGWNEDGVAITFDFDLDLNKNARLDSLKIKLQAIEVTTLESFDLDSYEFDLGNVVAGGVQQFNVNDTRGYTLAAGSQFNEVTLQTNSQVGGLQNYSGTFGQKLSWQEWIQNLDVDQVFYDNTEPNDNFNYKSSNYTNLINNYIIVIAIEANVYGEDSTLGTSGNTDYKLLARPITIYDYDEDDLSPSPRFTGTIETFTADGVTNLGGAIQTNGDDTLVKTTWVDNTFTFVSLWNYYGWHNVEPVNAQGYAIEELSSINTPPSGQLPIPNPPATLLSLSIVSGDCVMTSLIDGSAINPNINYKLSSRIQSPNRKSETEMLTFYTYNSKSGTPKTATIVKSGSTTQWDYSDGSALDVTNTPSHLFAINNGTYLVSANVDNYTDVTSITASFEISGNINLINFTNLTALDLQNNGYITSVTNPTTAGVFTTYNVSRNDLTGTLDLSGLTGLGGTVQIGINSNLTNVVCPVTTQTFTIFNVESCDVGYFDLSPMSNLTEVNNVTISIKSNSLTASEVNQFLVDLDTMSTNAYTGRTITIDGTNAAPDGSSGGYDGTTAKANLITKGFTVQTN
jgi:hypothetical protein